ncbi:MAG: response regulator [Verrucomicrobia bacterium]|nr:response regulator [Verrucomicrobiota bacterium]MCH8529112.1 response regulator [Kiritimatiellia bacterium]
MQIRQNIQRVFIGLAALLVVIGLGNLIMMQRVIHRGERATREISSAERLAAELNLQLGQLAVELRGGAADEGVVDASLARLVEVSEALLAGMTDPRAQRFVRKVRDFRMEFPDLPMEEREEWIEDLLLQSRIILAAKRDEVVAVQAGIRREQWLLTGGGAGLVLLGITLCLWAGHRFAGHVSERLRRVNGLATALASGDLSQTLTWKAEEEFMALSDSLNRLVHNLSLADAEISKEVNERMFAEKKALEAARAKSAFLAHMSHEFRTPLNGILGYTQVLLMDKGLSDKNKQVVNSLKRSGESLLELINDVLDLSKIEARSMKVQKSRFYLMDMLESLKESYADQVRNKGLAFSVEAGEDVPEDVLSDAIRLRQILVNLIGNAFKFTDAGGITLRVASVAGGVRFEVIDTGIGIAPGDLEKIFQPFVQVESSEARKSDGTGLGLSISNSLLEMMDSKLHVESEKGKGTRFWFVLPQPEREGRRLVVPARNISGYLGERRRIMLVDPGRETANTLTPLLKRAGFEVFEPTRAEQALEDGVRIRPDLILLEQNLPDMDGFVALARMQDQFLKEDRVPPPFVMISDHTNVQDRNASLTAGAVDVLSKPIRFMDVLEVLQKHLSVEWVYGDKVRNAVEEPPDTDEEMVMPPEPVLRQLLSFARAGDVRKLRETVAYMRGQEPQLDRFCRLISGLCANYQMNALVETLQKHVNTNPMLSHDR